jgi:beta-glucosidase
MDFSFLEEFLPRLGAVLIVWQGGMESGNAVADLLCGRQNPSGRLTDTVACSYDAYPCAAHFGEKQANEYYEDIYVGYRYFETFAPEKVLYPFGHGLSYTTFGYSDLRADSGSVTVTVTNTGSRAGGEVVQLYVAAPQDGIHRPKRELKGFKKVFLQPGESKEVRFALTQRSFAIWEDGWKIPGGVYTVCVGDLTAQLDVAGEEVAVPAWQAGSWYESCQDKPNQADWEKMLGKTYTAPVLKKGSFTMDNTVMEMKDYSLMMKLMFKATEMVVARGTGGKVDYENPEFKMMINAAAGGPLRSMQISGGIKGGLIPGMLEIANGHFFKGIWKMITG